MSDDELSYLQPGFDLSSLTVPRIRAILVSHDIPYPASAKKPQLIQILTDEVLPRSRKILSARARTKRTSKGITDMPSSQESSTVGGDDDQDGELMPPPPPKTPRGRKSKATPNAEAVAEDEGLPRTPATTSRARTPGRQKSTAKHPRASDTETEPDKPRPSARKTRKSTPGPVPVAYTPTVTVDEPDRRIKRESLENGASPFSDDNPFQSGSSPASESRRVSSTSRTRKSLGAPSTDRRKSASRRTQTASPAQTGKEEQFGVPSRSTFEFPVAKVKPEEVEDALPTTEEFTPEEQLELSRDRAAQGYSASESIPGRSSALVRRKRTPTSTAAKSAPVIILMTLLSAFGAWYRKEKIDIGYCGVGNPSWSLADNPQIPTWFTELAQPKCEPCPQHAYCYPGMEVACESNYVLQPHPLSLGGTVPLPPTCEPDGDKVKRIKAVADRAVDELRERRAVYECGDQVRPSMPETSASTGAQPLLKAGGTKLEIAEEDLKKEVGKLRRKGMSSDEFEDLWQSALGDITEREEVEVVRDGSGRVLLSSTSLARLPFTCSIRRSILQSISNNRIPLSVLILVLSAFAYVRSRILGYRQATAQIPTLVATTLDRLATQAALAADGRVSEGFISIGQLRDDVLRATFSATERERVWKGVRAIVEGNANVRAANREGGRTGEFSRVWEWIGPVNLAPGLEGRKSGGLITDRPASKGEERDDIGENSKEMIESRKWDEGRPIY